MPPGSLESELLRDLRRDVLRDEAEEAAHNFAVRDDLVDHRVRHIDRNGEADAHTTAGPAGSDGVFMPMSCWWRSIIAPPESPGLMGESGSNALVFDAQPTPLRGADDSHGGGFADSKWITDSEDHIANLQFRGIAESQRGHLRHRSSAPRCPFASSPTSLVLTWAVAQLHLDVGRAVNDVIVCQDRSIRRDDDAGAQTLARASWPRLRLLS